MPARENGTPKEVGGHALGTEEATQAHEMPDSPGSRFSEYLCKLYKVSVCIFSFLKTPLGI